MPRPISSVQLGTARFFAEVTDRVTDADLAVWVRSLARGLAFQRRGLNDLADELMDDVEDYRRAESERKRGGKPSKDSGGKTRKDAEVGGKHGNPAVSEHRQSNNQSDIHSEQPPYPPEVLGLLANFPEWRPRPQTEGGGASIVPTQSEVDALVQAWRKDPGYPWAAAVQMERGKGKGIRNLGTFVRNLPAVTPALIALQAKLTAPKAMRAPTEAEDWQEISAEDAERLGVLTPLYFANKLDAEGSAEFKALSDKYRRKPA